MTEIEDDGFITKHPDLTDPDWLELRDAVEAFHARRWKEQRLWLSMGAVLICGTIIVWLVFGAAMLFRAL